MVEIVEVPSPEHEVLHQRRQGVQGAFLSPMKKPDEGGLVDEIVEAPKMWSPGDRSDGSGDGDNNPFGFGGGITFKLPDDDEDAPAPVQNVTVKQGISAAMSSQASKRPASGASSAVQGGVRK